MDFIGLKKIIKTKDSSNMPKVQLALLGNCATQLLATAIRGTGIDCGLNLEVFDADYNQILEQTLDSSSELYQSNPQFILIQMCSEKLFEEYCEMPLNQRTFFAKNIMQSITQYWDSISQNCSARILQFDFVEIDDAVFGNYGLKISSSFISQIRRLNVMLMDEAETRKNVFLINLIQHIF